MKLILVVACALMAVAVAAPPTSEPVQIVRSDIKQEPDGTYNYVVETNDGTIRQEEGQLIDVVNEEGKTVKALVVRGSYSYVDPEGKPQNVVYSADQDGFKAEGDSIPKNPEPSRR